MKKQIKNLTVKAVANTQQIKGGKNSNVDRDVPSTANDNPIYIGANEIGTSVLG